MLPVSGAEQLKAIGAIAGLRPISSQRTPYSQLVESGPVALVGHEQVPQPLVARLGADLDEDLRIGGPGPDLVVERPQRLGLGRDRRARP